MNAATETEVLAKKHALRPYGQVLPSVQLCSARYSRCGRYLFAGGYDGLVHRFEVTGPDAIHLAPLAGHGGWVETLEFSPSGETFFTADSWGKLRCWRFGQEDCESLWEVPQAHDGWIHCLAVSRDGELVATCGNDRMVRVWSTRDGEPVCSLAGHEYNIHSVAFHPDGKSLVSGDLYGHIRHWDLTDGVEKREFDGQVLYLAHRLQEVGGVRVLRFSPDGKTLAAGGTRPDNGGNVQGWPTILMWDWASGALKHTLEVGGENEVFVRDFQFHEDGFLLVAISGGPGTGKLAYHRPGDEKPFFEYQKSSNCHSLTIAPTGGRLALLTTNRGSNGNGRRVDKFGNYIANHSPIHLVDFVDQTGADA